MGQVAISTHAGWIGGDGAYFSRVAVTRETREEWPLLTIETKVSGDSKSTNKRGPFLVGSLDSSCRYNIFLILDLPRLLYYFPHRTIFQPLT